MLAFTCLETAIGRLTRHAARLARNISDGRSGSIAGIESIGDDAWTPVRYPGAARDPDTGAWISDAEVAEVLCTAFASTPHAVTARLIERHVKDARYRDALFPVCGYHPVYTTRRNPSTPPTSSTAVAPSSKPYSPTSSTVPWPTCPPGVSAPTRPGSCGPRSPTTCTR